LCAKILEVSPPRGLYLSGFSSQALLGVYWEFSIFFKEFQELFQNFRNLEKNYSGIGKKMNFRNFQKFLGISGNLARMPWNFQEFL
jgi:hypothetical protein